MGLPDALKRVSKEDYTEILGPGIEPESFENFNCDTVAANARCYATLSSFKSDPLDSCEKNLVKTKSSETVGDYLCKQVERWLGRKADFKAEGKEDIRIPIYYSACGGDWTPVTDEGEALYVEEPPAAPTPASSTAATGLTLRAPAEHGDDKFLFIVKLYFECSDIIEGQQS